MTTPFDDYEDDGIDINSDFFENDFDDIDFDPIEIEDGDDDMAELLGY